MEFLGRALIEEVVDQALDMIGGNGPVDDLYRVSIGAVSGTIPHLLMNDDLLANLWGVGSMKKARSIVGAWASSICLYLLQNEPDRPGIASTLGENFAVLFRIDATAATQELAVLDKQRIAALHSGRASASRPSVALYIRARRALGDRAAPALYQLPSDLSAVSMATAGFGAAYPSPASLLLTSRIFTAGIRAAYDTFETRNELA